MGDGAKVVIVVVFVGEGDVRIEERVKVKFQGELRFEVSELLGHAGAAQAAVVDPTREDWRSSIRPERILVDLVIPLTWNPSRMGSHSNFQSVSLSNSAWMTLLSVMLRRKGRSVAVR
ncbi:hypothetical protein ACFX13_035487 [Malus domestica]